MEAAWLIAVLLAAMASFISNLGVTLQKLHHLRLAAVADGTLDKPGEGQRSSSGSSLDSIGGGNGLAANCLQGQMWRVGLFLVFFGSLADFAALSFGPQSLVAPLGSLTLVSNVIFAPLLLRETIGRWDVAATALIVIGSSVAVVFGSHDSVTFTVWQLFGFFARWDFVLYALVVAAYSGLLFMSIQKIERIEREDGVHTPRYAHYRALHRFAYPALSGTVGAQSVLFAKCVVELLANTWRNWQQDWDGAAPAAAAAATPTVYNSTAGGIPDVVAPAPVAYADSTNMFLYWQTYFVIGAMLGAISAQIKYLNDGLSRFDASYSVPVFTSHWIILSVVSGMIFYREYTGMDGGQCLLFACGVAITVTGVVTLGGREQTHPAAGSSRSGGGAHHPLAQHERGVEMAAHGLDDHDDELLDEEEFSDEERGGSAARFTAKVQAEEQRPHSARSMRVAGLDSPSNKAPFKSTRRGSAQELHALDLEMSALNDAVGSSRDPSVISAASVALPSSSSASSSRSHSRSPSAISGTGVGALGSSLPGIHALHGLHLATVGPGSGAHPVGSGLGGSAGGAGLQSAAALRDEGSLASGAKDILADAASDLQHAFAKLRRDSPFGHAITSTPYSQAIVNATPRADGSGSSALPSAAPSSRTTPRAPTQQQQHLSRPSRLDDQDVPSGRLEPPQPDEDRAADTLIQALKS